MDIEKKFQLVLIMQGLDYTKFGRMHGFSKVSVHYGIKALKNGTTYSAKVQKIIQDFVDNEIIHLRDVLNSELAA